jgi:hypothetical protein
MAGAQPSGLPIVNAESIAPVASRGGLLAEAAARHPAGIVEGELLHPVLARIEQLLKNETADLDVLIAPRDKWTARFQSVVAEKALAEGLVSADNVVKFANPGDLPEWIEAFVVAFIQREWSTHPFPSLPTETEMLDQETIRFALFSDWGTGLYGAPHIAAAIAREAQDAPFDYLIHLGDTYYTGEPSEVHGYLLNDWPQIAGAVSRVLNGNHEMYSGGHGYFDLALPHFQQPSSTFAIENDDWLIVGLDSAYQDWDLADNQVPWLTNRVVQAADRRLVLLTHHQPFSNTGQQGPKLQARLAALLEAKKIFAWYWGHEHICAIYDPHPAWGLYGRCIGNGGMPEPRHDYGTEQPEQSSQGVDFYRVHGPAGNPDCLALDGPNPYIPGHVDSYTAHGYLTIELSPSGITETYRDADGGALATLNLPS